jgi:signal transduction histidine kinase
MQVTQNDHGASVAPGRQPPSQRPALLAVVAHDLRQPASAALMAADFAEELLEVGTSLDTVRQQLAIIRRCMRDALRLTEDLLTVGQVEAGTLRLRRAPVDCAAVLLDAVVIIAGAARAKRIDVHIDGVTSDRAASSGGTPCAHADRQRLRQVLSNLCDNAIKATPAGGCIRLSASVDARGAHFAVTDSGPGLPEATLARIFDQYWQAEQDRSANGVGLGLSIARWLVELHGGTIRATNAPSGGLMVRFTVPPAEVPLVEGAATMCAELATGTT